MALPTTITDLSVTATSNSPAGTEVPTINTGPDDFIRELSAIIRREQAQFTAVASAATVDLGAIATGNYGHITGTVTITSFGTVAAGIERTVVFDGILTLTHNATSLILRTGANRTTAAGDVAVFVSEGAGNWREKAYHTALSFQPLDATLTALAAQTTAANNVQAYSGPDTPVLLSTGTASGNIPLVGTTSATETLAGLSARATTALAVAGADDAAHMTPLKARQARKVLQVVHLDDGALATGTTIIPYDDTIPQQTEGDQYMSLSITPLSSTSTLVIDVAYEVSVNTTAYITSALFRDGGADAIGATVNYVTSSGHLKNAAYSVKSASGSTAATTFKLRIGPSVSATITFNGSGGARTLGGKMSSSMRITEIEA